MPRGPNKGCAAFFYALLTDPPYLVDYHDRSGRSLAGDSNGQWLGPAFAESYRVLKPGGFCVSFYGWNRVDQFFAAWRAAGFRPVGHLVWVKSYSSSQGLLAYQHEAAYLLARETAAHGHKIHCPTFWSGSIPATGCIRHKSR